MNSRFRILVAPAYLFACLLLGGSAQGVWANMILQLVGVAIIVWAALDQKGQPLSKPAWQLLLLALACLLLVTMQMIPLPAAIWTHLGGRTVVADGFRALGRPLPFQPISLTPEAGLSCLLGAIPPLAIICAMIRLKAYRPVGMFMALVAAAFFGIALGALQVTTWSGDVSHFYLYPQTNGGRAVGFFANADHMGTLLVVAIPCLAAIIAAARTSTMQRRLAIITVTIGLAGVVLVGILLNGSLAALGLALPVAAASLLVVLPLTSRLRPLIMGVALVLTAGSLIALQSTSIGGTAVGEHARSAMDSRSEILATTGRAAKEFMPFGSGLGSFREVYRLYEDPREVTPTYVVHAHNDYAELILELGLFGALLLVAFLGWWIMVAMQVWKNSEPMPFARAAAIASAAVLAHSLVDFPLRTAAIASAFAMFIALLADQRGAPPHEPRALRRKRHVEFR